jgi:hypothetical protein
MVVLGTEQMPLQRPIKRKDAWCEFSGQKQWQTETSWARTTAYGFHHKIYAQKKYHSPNENCV